jgi:flagellar protein FliL
MTDRAFEDVVEPAAAESPKKKLPLKLLLMVGGPVAALGLLLLGLWLLGIGPFAAAAPEPPPPVETAKASVFFDLPELLVNLNAEGRKTSFLKLAVALELESEAEIEKVEAVLPRVIDNFQVYLRELRAADIKGSAGMYRLREELLARVAVAAAPAKIKDVLFREVLVQ